MRFASGTRRQTHRLRRFNFEIDSDEKWRRKSGIFVCLSFKACQQTSEYLFFFPLFTRKISEKTQNAGSCGSVRDDGACTHTAVVAGDECGGRRSAPENRIMLMFRSTSVSVGWCRGDGGRGVTSEEKVTRKRSQVFITATDLRDNESEFSAIWPASHPAMWRCFY